MMSGCAGWVAAPHIALWPHFAVSSAHAGTRRASAPAAALQTEQLSIRRRNWRRARWNSRAESRRVHQIYWIYGGSISFFILLLC